MTHVPVNTFFLGQIWDIKGGKKNKWLKIRKKIPVEVLLAWAGMAKDENSPP